MKRKSYKIKHDFLFDCDDSSIELAKCCSNFSEMNELKISDVLRTKDEDSFMKLIDASKTSVAIKDDIGSCVNPASERYKQFIIRCVCCKLKSRNITIYL